MLPWCQQKQNKKPLSDVLLGVSCIGRRRMCPSGRSGPMADLEAKKQFVLILATVALVVLVAPEILLLVPAK